MKHNYSLTDDCRSILTQLRTLLPDRPLRLPEALFIAELQADRLRTLSGIDSIPVPFEVVTELPRIVIAADPELPGHAASGSSHWDAARRCWIIAINEEEPGTRQRFTVMHEFKHIIDHGHHGLAGRLPTTIYRLPPAEYIADYFAGCLLLPKRDLKAAYFDGIQRVPDLAELFDVSPKALQVRLSQLGLIDRADGRPKGARYRLQPPRSQGTYYRSTGRARATPREKVAA